jgi:D-beta-D-heptose 7-phosphate kinase/D-beta-D-heptose 1-phosphate adenosyltransferase
MKKIPTNEAIVADVLKAVKEDLGKRGRHRRLLITPRVSTHASLRSRHRPKLAGRETYLSIQGADAVRHQGAFSPQTKPAGTEPESGLPSGTHAEILAAGSRLAGKMPGTHILVTEGDEGMTLFLESQPPEHVASTPRQVFDVTGAGDTVLATITMAVTAGASWSQAMPLATEAAGIAIGKMGSVAVSLGDLQKNL